MNAPPAPSTGPVLLLEHRMPSRLTALAGLADAVGAALPDREDLAFAANLCLEELVTNVVGHGLAGAPDHEILVRLRRSPDWLEIELRDDAPRFDPFRQAPAPDLALDVERRPVGGLGVHLVKALMDEARAEHDGTGNRIVLRKNLRRSGANEQNSREDGGMSFECSVDEHGGTRVFAVRGRVDGANAADMEQALKAAFDAPGRRAVVDCAGMNYISSAGLRVILVLAKQARAAGGRLVLCGLLPHVREVFEFSGFLKIIDVEPDRAAALAALG